MNFSRTVLALMILTAVATLAQSRDSRGYTPESVVERFCRLDQEGALLDPQGIDRVRASLLWVPTTKWLNLYVVRNFRVIDSKIIGSHDAEVTVEWDRIGRIKNGKFEADRAVRRSIYQLQLSEQEWQQENGEPVLKETEPRWRLRRQTQPHLSPEVAIEYLKRLQTETEDEAERAEFQQQIVALQNARKVADVTPAPVAQANQNASPARER